MMNYKVRAGFFKMIPMAGMLAINVSDATAYAAVKVRTDDFGLIYPELKSLHVDFGNTDL